MQRANDVFRGVWVRGINLVEDVYEGGLSTWLRDGDYQILRPTTASEFELDISYSSSQILEALAFDCNRFATACFETVLGAGSDTHSKSALAWPMIRYYYAAFFACHSIMRAAGQPFIYLNHGHCRRILEIAQSYGVVTSVAPSRGAYTWDIDVEHGKVICRNSNTGRSGVHESFWWAFVKLLDLATEAALTSGNTDVQPAVDDLTNLRDILTVGGTRNGSYLSDVRNEINYRLGQEVWFPYGKKMTQNIGRQHLAWNSDWRYAHSMSSDEHELRRFSETCLFLVSTCCAMLSDMARRSGRRHSFLEDRAIRFLHSYVYD